MTEPYYTLSLDTLGQQNMDKVNPGRVRFIKLGRSGEWEKKCIEEDGTVRLGYQSPYHENSIVGDWETVRKYWLDFRKGNERVATNDVNQIRDFYELSENDLWITFYNRKLYWCFAKKDILELEDGSRIRETLNGWSCKDLLGNELRVENIDGRVTKVQGFRGTICRVELKDYLVAKINGIVQKEVAIAKSNLAQLKGSVKPLIKGLWWKDFELLVDLIFSQSGWQRVSVLGQTEKAIDLDIFSTVSGRRAFVQVKSRASIATLQDSIAQYKEMEQFDEMYFVVHTASKSTVAYAINDGDVHIWDIEKLADLVINLGLVNWLIAKRS